MTAPQADGLKRGDRRRFRKDIEGLCTVGNLAVLRCHTRLGAVPRAPSESTTLVISGCPITDRLWRDLSERRHGLRRARGTRTGHTGYGNTKGVLVGSEKHLNSHQRDIMAHIFRHPLSHNIEWHSVLSLLNAVATVQETHKGNYVVTIGSESETFEPPRHKDVDAEQVATLRRLLRRAGYGPEEMPA